MDYLQVAGEFNLSDDFNYSIIADQESYGCFFDNFYWFDKSDFHDFLLYHMPCLCFITFDGRYRDFPDPINDQLKRHFGTPEIALDVMTGYQDFVRARLTEDNEYSKIVHFCNEHLNPANSLRWIGKFTDLLTENTDFANDQRKMYHGTTDHVHLSELAAFCTFLNDINYLHNIKEEYEIGMEFKGEIESMKSEPDYYFPTSKESLESLHEFIKEKRGQKNVMTIALRLFPGISFNLNDDPL